MNTWVNRRLENGAYDIHQLLNNGETVTLLAESGEGQTYLVNGIDEKRVIKVYGCPMSNQLKGTIKMVQKLCHPAIAKILSYGEISGHAYEVREYYEQENLIDNPQIFATAVLGLADAINELHINGFRLLDIKPENFILTHNRAVIVDIGSFVGFKSDGSIGFTQIYSAPETKSKLDFFAVNSDFYSLGITLFEILTGKNPFEGLLPQNCINADLTDLQNAKENPQWWFPEKENGNALGLLISKLIEPEISQRWGYTEILRWHENINKSLIAQEVVSFHNRFNGSCKYNNVIVNDPKELIRKIAGNWDYEYLFNHFSEISYTDTYIANKTGLYIAYTHPKDPENISNEEKMSLMISLYCEFTQDDDEVFWPNKGFKNTFEFGNYLYNTINKLYGKYSSRENDYESLSYDSTFCILYSAAVAGLFSTYMSKDRLANTNERTKIITECEKAISKSNSFYDIIKSFALLAYTMMNICVFSITVPSSNQEIIVHSYEELGKVLRDNMNTYGDSIILLGSLIYNQKQISPIVQAWSDALKNYSGR